MAGLSLLAFPAGVIIASLASAVGIGGKRFEFEA